MITEPEVKGYLSEHYGEDAYRTVEGFESRGGFAGLRRAVEMEPGEVVEFVKDSGLRGRGGAGFSAGLKWSFMPQESDHPKVLVANGDESEPGSFKDRLIMERAPLQMLEGILVAAWATGAEKTFIYIRGESALAIERVREAVAEAGEKGYLGQNILGAYFKWSEEFRAL